MEGYDANFVSEIPSDMECGICLFVVRDPIQIMACGHRFCSHCFEKLKTLPAERLRCPKDNGNINFDMVFYDKAAQRAVSNLAVKCSKTCDGCSWQGSLHELEMHVNGCYFHNKSNSVYQEHIVNQLKVLEEAIKKKDEEYFELKNKNFHLEQEFIKHKKEITSLTNSINACLNELLVSNHDLTMRFLQLEKLKLADSIGYDKNTSLTGPGQRLLAIPSDKTTSFVKPSTTASLKRLATPSNVAFGSVKPSSSTKPSVKLSTTPSANHLAKPSNATLTSTETLSMPSSSSTKSKLSVTTSGSIASYTNFKTTSSSNNSAPLIAQYPAVSWTYSEEPVWNGEFGDWDFDFYEESNHFDYDNYYNDEDEFGYYNDDY